MATFSAAQRAKIRRLSQPKELAPDEEGGELNIVPFLDIIVNVLIFVLATVAVTFTTSIAISPPGNSRGGVRDEIPRKALNLTILVVGQGFSVKAEGGNVGPGCEGRGAGLTLPFASGEFDYVGLQRCAAKLKAGAEEFAEERVAFLAGNPEIPYSVFIRAMDALRASETGEELFPDIQFKVTR
jgi:biopolymer transport protein TolR